LIGAKSVDRPVKNARKISLGGEVEPEDSNETVAVDPGRRLEVFIVNAGKALTGSGGLVGGQDLMKDRLVSDELGSTSICRYPCAFKGLTESCERLGVCIRETILAWLGSLAA